jgi:hypothetical protein
MVLALAAFALLLLAAAPARAGGALTGQQIRALISGNTLFGADGTRPIEFSYTPEGRVYGTIGSETGNGSWRIRDGDRYCHEWSEFFDATERCYQWHVLNGGRYRMVNVDAYRVFGIDVWRIRPGLD